MSNNIENNLNRKLYPTAIICRYHQCQLLIPAIGIVDISKWSVNNDIRNAQIVEPFELRRPKSDLVLYYKYLHDLVALPYTDYFATITNVNRW